MGLGKLPDDDDPANLVGGGGLFADINITPLTDIFLVLLIIFMVTSRVEIEQAQDQSRLGMKVTLPKGSSKDIDREAASLTVSILKDGQVLVQNQPVKQEALEGIFKTAAARDASTQVIIEADEGVRHGEVVSIMGLAKQAGLTRLAIATRAAQ